MAKLDQRLPSAHRAAASGELALGRDCYEREAWADAYEALAVADRASPLGAADLERLAVSAYLLGREGEFCRAQDRAHRLHLRAGRAAPAARCAFWLGLCLLLRGEVGPSTGWLARARRLVARAPDCVEHGYLLLPEAEGLLDRGAWDPAYAAAERAAEIAERSGDADLLACARHLQGRALIMPGRMETGLALLDEAMTAVASSELSPLMAGLIHCSVIDACNQVFALDRSRAWTAALARWRDRQPQLIAFTGACSAHLAEVFRLQGEWLRALREAQRAIDRFAQGIDRRPPGEAAYQKAEAHRLLGDFAAAEEAYRTASQWGCDPQPGFALLRFAQGRREAAAVAVRRALETAATTLERARLLPAFVEIMLATGALDDSRAASAELEALAERYAAGLLGAMAAQGKGAVQLASGDALAALGSLRRAWRDWSRAEAPYEAARARALIGLALRALGDEDGAWLELDAARDAFASLGAAPDLARLEAVLRPAAGRQALTQRERQVLRLIAAGETNRSIAAQLSLSARTVDRHVSNLFGKLGVASRAAAAAYACRHDLA